MLGVVRMKDPAKMRRKYARSSIGDQQMGTGDHLREVVRDLARCVSIAGQEGTVVFALSLTLSAGLDLNALPVLLLLTPCVCHSGEPTLGQSSDQSRIAAVPSRLRRSRTGLSGCGKEPGLSGVQGPTWRERDLR
jgi:hypothetical protein